MWLGHAGPRCRLHDFSCRRTPRRRASSSTFSSLQRQGRWLMPLLALRGGEGRGWVYIYIYINTNTNIVISLNNISKCMNSCFNMLYYIFISRFRLENINWLSEAGLVLSIFLARTLEAFDLFQLSDAELPFQAIVACEDCDKHGSVVLRRRHRNPVERKGLLKDTEFLR